jgi:small-conductance mechanosensitive channel
MHLSRLSVPPRLSVLVALSFALLSGAALAGCSDQPVVEDTEGSFTSETVQLEEATEPGADSDTVESVAVRAAPPVEALQQDTSVADTIPADPAAALSDSAAVDADSAAAPDSAALVRQVLTPPIEGPAPSDSAVVPNPNPFVVSVLGRGRDSVLVRAEEFAHGEPQFGYAFIGPHVAPTWETAVIVVGSTFEIVQPRTFSADSSARYIEVRTVHQGVFSDEAQRVDFTVRRQTRVISLIQIIGRTMETLLVLVLTWAFLRGASWLLNMLGERNPSRRLFFKRLDPAIRTITWLIVVVFIVRVFWEVGQSQLIAVSAAAGVAIGLAAQDVVRNLFGGIVLLTDQPFQVGDKIQIGDTYGEVKSIGIRSTRVTTPDDSEVTVPNSVFLAGDVSNANAGNLDMQVVIHLYLPGWVDLRLARKIAYESAAVSRYVFLDKPIVVIALDEYHDTFVTHLKVKAYVLDIRDEFLFTSDVTERARAEFRKAGLTQPYHGARAWYDVTEAIEEERDGREAST